jgi:hypothetical protein
MKTSSTWPPPAFELKPSCAQPPSLWQNGTFRDAKETATIAGIDAFPVYMRRTTTLACTCLVLIGGTVSAFAFRPPETNTAFPTQHQLAQRYADTQKQPYAMNYTDEAAQRLGVHDGRWEAFETRSSDPLMPSFKGGVDSGGAMFKLQWGR